MARPPRLANGTVFTSSHLTPHSSLTWLFDLDNTLHDASPHIFPHINRAMTAYVAEALGVPVEEANRLRIDYWQRYGATLTGMMRHHATDPDHFLFHTHQFPALRPMVIFERALRPMLRRLPGRKIVFSNAPRHYAEAVLDVMGVRGAFDGVWTIEHMRFQPKPHHAGFRRLLRAHELDPRRCIMIEDSAENLRTAKRLGMKTVLISRSLRVPGFVDLRLQSALDLPRHLRRFR